MIRQKFLLCLFVLGLSPTLGSAQPLLKSAIQVDAGNTKLTGATFGYRLTYNCSNTSGPCLEAEVIDLLPASVQFVSTVPASPTGDVFAINVTPNFMGMGRTRVQFDLIDPLPAGNSGDLIINVRFPNGTTPDGTVASNTADGVNLQTTPGTFTTPLVNVTAVAQENVTLSKTLTSSPANLDLPESYRLRINNQNADGTLNVTAIGPVVDTLPPGTVFNGATPAADCQPGCVGTTPATVTWTAPCTVPLGPNQNCDITVNVTYPSATFPSGTNVTNQFTADGTVLGEPPQNFGIGTVTHPVTTFVPAPSATLNKNIIGSSPSPPTLNQTFSYSFALGNNGNVPLSTPVVIDTLPVELNVLSVTTGNYTGASDFAAGEGVRVSYEKNTAPGIFTLWGSSPNTATNTTLTAPPPGLGAGEYLTGVRWQYGQAAVGMATSTRPQITGRIINPDNAGGPVAIGDLVNNCVDLTSVYTGIGGPTNVNRNACQGLNVSGPFVQLSPAKEPLSGGGPFNPGQNVSFRLRVRSDARSSDPVALADLVSTDLLPVDLLFNSWTFDDQGTGLPAPQVFQQIPNFAGTGRTLLRWRWNAGSGNLGIGQGVAINITTTLRSGVGNGTLTNTFNLEEDSPGLEQRCAGTSTADAQDFDGDGDTTELLCTEGEGTNVAGIAQLISGKQIQASCDGAFTSTSQGTLAGGSIEYRLRVQNVGTIPMQNFVLIDILPFVGDTGVRDTNPRGSQWTPLLSAPIEPPAGTVLYYSTSGNPCRGEVGGPVTGCDPPNWSTVPPVPITSTRSFKVEFGSRVVNAFDFLEFDFQMATPGNVPAASIAFNSFAYQGERADGLGSLAAEPVKVGVAPGTCVAASLGDFVWVDLNANGLQDDGPTGLNGVYVELFQPGTDGIPGTFDDVLLSSTITGPSPTNTNGWYRFPALAPGNYFVRFHEPPTYVFTNPNQGGNDAQDSDANQTSGLSHLVTLSANQDDPTIDAGLIATQTAALGNYVWFDVNGDGIQNESPFDGVNGVSVRLFVDDGDGVQEPTGGDALVASTVTTDDIYGQTGYYMFDLLSPGLPYFVQFVLPASALGFTTQNAGANDAVDSDANLANGTGAIVILDPNEIDLTHDAGLVRPTGLLALGDQVWFDPDNDGIYEPENGEMGIDNVRLFLYVDENGDGAPTLDEFRGATETATVSNFPGRYRFNTLQADNYLVVIDPLNFSGSGPLAGWISATGNDPAPDPDDDVNGDDNGTDLGALTGSRPVTLTTNGEPTSEDGNANTNLTVDFGFISDTAATPIYYDYGDAPDNEANVSRGEYNTTALDTGAFHRLGAQNAPFLGACVDADNGFNQDLQASEDDTTASATTFGTCVGGDDEDGVTFTSPFQPGNSATFTVNTSGPASCTLNAWVDWNQNGVFNDAGEAIATNVALIPGVPLPLANLVPANAIPGLTYARFRCSTSGSLPPTGFAADGEVEDYVVGILGSDLGDAPASYGTQGAGAAIHTINPTTTPLMLGSCVDTDVDGQPNAAATGDDTTIGTSRIGSCFDDEDGVSFLTPVTACQTAQVTVTASGAGLLNAWLDFNADGDFGDAGEQVFTDQALNPGANPLTFNVPCTTVSSTTYSRFRISTAGGLNPTGGAANGEVEDYAVNAGAVDFGDAPDTYQTLLGSGGPNHRATGPTLGATRDTETAGQPSVAANGDGADEDGVTPANGAFLRACEAQNFTVNSSGASSLNAWIDFDRNGVFNDPADRVATNVAVVAGNNNLAVNVPCGASPGQTYARFRLSSTGATTPGGPANEGEIEDYTYTIRGIDFGDLPDPTYPTLLASNGARHTIVPGFSLGANEDTEADGQPDAAASGDDTNGTPDDEDGVTLPASIVACSTGNAVTVVLTNSAGVSTPGLDGWIDFNDNGNLTDPGERIFNNTTLATGTNNLTFDVPCTAAVQTTTYARFRLSSTGGLGVTGNAVDGEVEDYVLPVLGVDLGDAPDTYSTLVATTGPRHTVLTGFSLGATLDNETDGQPSAAADGDGADEDGITFSTLLLQACVQDVPLTVSLTNSIGAATPQLDGWIDFNGDGDFDHPAEHLFGGTSQGLNTGNNNLTFDVPCSSVSQISTYARFRLSSAGSLPPTGTPAANGEVEDYLLGLTRVDLGDAPDTYGTLIASNGPRHSILDGFVLGVNIDPEADGQPDATATGDDTNGTPDDEDGVTMDPILLACSEDNDLGVTLSNADPNRPALLDGWIDFDGNGTFDPNEHLFGGTSIGLASGANLLNFDVPCSALPRPATYARFRLSSTGGLAPTSTVLVNDGEVEDYAVGIRGVDLGDAPDTYGTLIASQGPIHGILDNYNLGTTADPEPDGQPSTNADGDDNNATDDEDGVVFPNGTTLAACLLDVPMTVTLTNTDPNRPALLDGWIDFDDSGTFDPNEHLFGGTSTPLVAGPNALTFDVPCAAVPQTETYVRVRLSTTGSLSPTSDDPSLDGEVEDHLLQLVGADLGDAPDSYGTTLAANGARHTIVDGFLLGTIIDNDADGQPNAAADGDDAAGQADDEDGVVFPNGNTAFTCSTLNPLTVTLTNNDPNRPALLDGWLDFNGDGDFDPNEHLFGGTSATLTVGSNALTYSVPCNAVAQSTTYARFRLSSAGGLPPTSTNNAADGEVEDYAFELEPGVDFGDVPDTFGTLTASNGASHTIVDGYLLGTAIDAEADGQPDPNALLDDVTGAVDDEDGVTFNGTTTQICAEDVPLNVTLTNTSGLGTARLDAWLDFNGNGAFDPNEHLFGGTSAPLVSGANALTFDVPCDAVPQTAAGARFRLSSKGNLPPTGSTGNGEVEDYLYGIQGLDYGDAPNTYGTTNAQNGPVHPILPGFGIGPQIDSEPDGQADPNAAGDDQNGQPDDEDGVTFPGSAGAPACSEDNQMTVVFQNAPQGGGFVDIWIDFNGNGVFEHPAEHIDAGTSRPVTTGPNILDYDVPCDATVGSTFIRIRLSQTGGLTPTGVGPVGEVEDHAFQIGPIATLCERTDGCFNWGLVEADFDSVPGQVALTWSFQNTCTSPLQRMDLRFIPGATVLSPTEGQVLVSEFGRTYTADVVGGDHPGVGFTPQDPNQLSGGALDVFTVVVDADSLDPDVVLWNNASTTDGQAGRIDIRSGLCFQMPTPDVRNARACARPSGEDQWRVEVQWDRTRTAQSSGYHLLRQATETAQPQLVSSKPIRPDASGTSRFSERLEAGGVVAYWVQPLDIRGQAIGEPVRIDVDLCPATVPATSEPALVLLLTLLTLGGLSALLRSKRQQPRDLR